jgi:hypothetical protein
MEYLNKQNIIIGSVVLILLVVSIITYMFGGEIRDTVKAWQKASADQDVITAREEAAASKVDSENAKKLAADTLKDLAETKDELGKQIDITKAAEVKLYDSNKISEDSKKDYEAYKNKVLTGEYHSTNANLNTDELCQRAKSLGISCD